MDELPARAAFHAASTISAPHGEADDRRERVLADCRRLLGEDVGSRSGELVDAAPVSVVGERDERADFTRGQTRVVPPEPVGVPPPAPAVALGDEDGQHGLRPGEPDEAALGVLE